MISTKRSNQILQVIFSKDIHHPFTINDSELCYNGTYIADVVKKGNKRSNRSGCLYMINIKNLILKKRKLYYKSKYICDIHGVKIENECDDLKVEELYSNEYNDFEITFEKPTIEFVKPKLISNTREELKDQLIQNIENNMDLNSLSIGDLLKINLIIEEQL
eukprot:TRINITY_DN85161_c0_g1_i1.p1 TRINITY_DN85161_c0_g1~~TRINITY_DN85161_c0_g1_i1.p1  ORF type:complete len:162 (-),score=5.23 TRINITY_DN85161_c0_g1_i1:92-577(-)